MSETADSPSRRTVDRRLFTGLVVTTVVALCAALALGLSELREDNRVSSLLQRIEEGTIEEAVRSADDDPANRHVTLSAADSEGTARVDAVVTDDEHLFLTGGTLPAAGGGRTYQLWAEAGGPTVSIGVLGSEIEPFAFLLPEGTTRISVTQERAPGSASPSSAPVVSATLS